MAGENRSRLDRLKKELLLHMKNYIVTTMRARDEMCTAMKKEFPDGSTDFYNVSIPAKHIRVMRILLTILEKYKPHQHLQDAFAVWDLRLAPAVFALRDNSEQWKYCAIAKLLAACLFDSDEYTKAIICLGHAVRLYGNDLHARLLLLYWLSLLGHWSLARIQLDRQKDVKKFYLANNEIVDEALSAIINLHTVTATKEHYPGDALAAHQKAFEMMKSFESILSGSKSKTFLQYEAHILIKRVLIAASHFSFADLTKVGDPLQNMDIIKARYETLVKCRSNAFYGTNEKLKEDGCNGELGKLFLTSGGAELQDSKIHDYLKMNSAAAEHFKAVYQLCLKYLELGILRECESEGLRLFQQVLKAANLQRCLAILNVILLSSTLSCGHIGSSVHHESFRSLAASLWNKKPKETPACSTAEEEITKNRPIISSSETEEIIDLCDDEPNGLRPANKRDKNFEDKLMLEEHDDDCNCVICSQCLESSEMRLEATFSKFLLHQFSSKGFRSLSQQIQDLPRETLAAVNAICLALQTEPTDDIIAQRRYPLDMLELFLVAAIRWLRRVAEEEKPVIVREVIRESLKICAMDAVRFRWQWLTIRQLARRPVQIPKLEWLRVHNAPTKPGLRSPLKSIVNNLATELNALTLCSPRPARNLNLQTTNNAPSTKLPEMNQKAVMNAVPSSSSSTNLELEEAKKDFDSFSHLFYREWRFQTCSYLGQACAFQQQPNAEGDQWSKPGWSAAYYFTEAMSISTRQLARTIPNNSSDHGAETFHFGSIEKFKEAVQCLPSDLTVVELFLDSRRILWLIKMYSKRTPLVVPIASVPQDDPLLRRFIKLLLENDESGSLSKTCTDAKKYWTIRRRLDSKLKTIINELETEWFGIFGTLLLPCLPLNGAHNSVIEEITSNGFSGSTAAALAENLDLKVPDWKQLVQRFAALEGLDEVVALHLCDCRSRWISKFKKESFSRNRSNNYVLFCVSPELASFPFELLPVMESHQRVCRISSFHMFEQLLSRSKEIPKTVDGRNSFYVLDPGGDLTDTQKRLSKELQKYTYWKGTIGEAPKPEELRNFLETSDLFFYMGHGSGGRYFGRSAVLRSNCRAVSLLMGCSSVRVVYEGEGFDGRGAVYDYIIAKCPCVVGCLWMVTDGEIDRVFLALLNYCFSEIEKHGDDEVDASSSYRLLIDGIAYARNACKLKYMTGGAVVAYGLPIVTHLGERVAESTSGHDPGEISELQDDDSSTALTTKKKAIVTNGSILSEKPLENQPNASGKPTFY